MTPVQWGFYFPLTEQRCCWLYRSENENSETTNLKDPGLQKGSAQVVNWNALEHASGYARLKLLRGTEFQFIANFLFFLPSILDLDGIYLQMKAIKSLGHCCVSPIQMNCLLINPPWYFHLQSSRYKDLNKNAGTHTFCSMWAVYTTNLWNVVFLSMTFKNNSLNSCNRPHYIK